MSFYTCLIAPLSINLQFQIGLSVLTIPFVVTAWLFFGLRDPVDGTFPAPISVTFPESEYHTLHSSRRCGAKLYTVTINYIDPTNWTYNIFSLE